MSRQPHVMMKIRTRADMRAARFVNVAPNDTPASTVAAATLSLMVDVWKSSARFEVMPPSSAVRRFAAGIATAVATGSTRRTGRTG